MRTLNIHCDGSCYYKDRRMGMGVAFFEDDSLESSYQMKVTGQYLGTNNEAEYLAIIHALTHIILHKDEFMLFDSIIINSDSELVINQIKGVYRVNTPTLVPLKGKVHRYLVAMHPLNKPLFNWVSRTHPRQKVADKLSREANEYYR